MSGIYTLQPDYRNGFYQFQANYLCLIFTVVGIDCAALYLVGSNESGIYTLQPDYRNGFYQFQANYLCLIFSVVGMDCAALYLVESNVSGIYTLQPDYRNGFYQFQANFYSGGYGLCSSVFGWEQCEWYIYLTARLQEWFLSVSS